MIGLYIIGMLAVDRREKRYKILAS
jgi:hypothetical protein